MDANVAARQWIIGVDVGGTKIAAAAVDPACGTLAHRREIATQPDRAPEAILEDIAQLVESVAASVHLEGDEIAGIGIGVPEIVDGQGHIHSAYLLDWDALPLRDRLVGATPTTPGTSVRATPASPGGPRGHNSSTFAPIRFESDVRAAALAESRFGAGQPYRLMIYVSVGTGISSTLVQDGVPLVGSRGGAVVLSTAPISVPSSIDGAWREFVLEDFASGKAIAHRYREASGNPTADAHDVILAATDGDQHAVAIVDSAAHALGSAIGWLVNVLDPEAVVIGGGLSRAGGRYWEALTQSTRAHIWNSEARELPILPAALGKDAGVIGAALAALALNSGRSPRETLTPSPSPSALGGGCVDVENRCNMPTPLAYAPRPAGYPLGAERGWGEGL